MPQLPRVEIPIDELRERLAYDPETGVLRWRKGQVAGHVTKGTPAQGGGYREIEWRTTAPGKRKGRRVHYLRAHRVAWALATGAWPINEIDHRDGARDNNRWRNLREATRAENAQNLVQEPRGKSGVIGASRTPGCKDRWRADMNGRYLGAFGSAEEAHQAYLAAKAKYHPFQPQPRGG